MKGHLKGHAMCDLGLDAGAGRRCWKVHERANW